MYLRQRQMTPERLYDLFRNLAHVVPLSYPANGDTCPATHGRPPRISARREIRLPVSVTVSIDFEHNAPLKLRYAGFGGVRRIRRLIA